MDNNQLKKVIYLLLGNMIILGCASLQLLSPKNTSIPKLSSTPMRTATSTQMNLDSFIGNWIEYWPGLTYNDTYSITMHGDEYQIEGIHSGTSQYPISKVRMDGDTLKFSEKADVITVEYELRVKDPQTLSVRAKGMSGWRDDIIWKRV
jgi:hypothetical protein